jgi:hypothetical protein
LLFVLVLSLATLQGGIQIMSMALHAEAVSAFQAQAAAAALFPVRAPLLAPPPPLDDEIAPAAKVDNRLEVPLSELTFRHLKTADEIAGIVHLRREIQLVAASGADPSFVAREKKETNRALSPLSSAAARS